ncbi:MAG TPA: hypothetical protein VNX86_13750 [Rhizomicrobium sp.]|jgi:hypothetical protein|nr:hypothetical protein [Rhizomicrobium sp.]
MMQALVVLPGANGAVVSRDDLMTQCWGGRIVRHNDGSGRERHHIQQRYRRPHAGSRSIGSRKRSNRSFEGTLGTKSRFPRWRYVSSGKTQMGQQVEQLTADERIDHYRKMAAAVRRIAAASRSEEFRDDLDRLAVSYETLATDVAKREFGTPLPLQTAGPLPEDSRRVA